MDKLTEHTIALIRTLVRSFLSNGNLDRAREMIEQMRIACDELTAEINERRSMSWPRGK